MDGNGHISVLLACRRQKELSLLDEMHTGQGILRVIGGARDAEEAVRKTASIAPAVVVLDGDAPEYDALNTALAIGTSARNTGVILLGGEESPDYLRQAMRAGVKESLDAGIDTETLADTIAAVAAVQRQMAPPEEPFGGEDGCGSCRVISIAGGKEGVGKTTIAVNLAVTLARVSGEQVALVDLAFGDAAVMLNLVTREGFGEMMSGQGEIDPASLREVIRQHESGVSVLPRTARLRYMEQDPVDPYAVQVVIQFLREHFRFVVVDNPPLRLETELQTLSLVDEVLCITTPWDIITLRNTRAFLDAAVGTFCPSDHVRLVLNRSDDRAMISRADVEKALQRAVSVYVPNDARLVASSINVGIPFAISKPESTVARAIRGLASTIAGEQKRGAAGRRGFALFR